MCRNNREDIFNLVPINIISSKFHVKVIGGGKAATIKVKGLLEKYGLSAFEKSFPRKS